MQLRHLEVFHAVMLTGTITAAAKMLHISQPAATRLLLRAEDVLGYKLFERVKGRLVPTREAQVHAESERVIAGLEHLRTLSRNLGMASSGHLRIAAAPALCLDLVPSAITRFRRRHPDVSFTIDTRQYADLVEAVLTQEVDLGLGFDVQPHPGLETTALSDAEFFGIFPAALARSLPETVKLDRFRRHPFIGLRRNDPLGNAYAAALKVAGVLLQPIVEVQTNRVALSLVAQGAGAAIVDQYTAAARDPRTVVARRLDPPIRFAVHSLHARHRPLSVLARRFAATVTQLDRDLVRALHRSLPGG